MRSILLICSLCVLSYVANSQEFECDSIGLSGPLSFIIDNSVDEVCPGSNFCLDFTSQNFDNLLGFQFTVSFDPCELSFESFLESRALRGSIAANTNVSDNGQIAFLWTDIEVEGFSVDDSTSLFVLCFEAIGESDDAIDIFLNENLPPNFPPTSAIYQSSTGSSCVSDVILLNGQDSLSFNLCCLDVDITNVTNCFLDGTISVDICGVSLPYVVNLLDEQNNVLQSLTIEEETDQVMFEGLEVGDYILSVTDSFNLSISEQISIESTSPIIYDIVFSDPSCNFSGDGFVSISNIQGGTPPYVVVNEAGLYYKGQDENTYEGLEIGTYRYFISDANGCEIIEEVTLFKSELIVDIIVNAPTCSTFDDGSIEVIPSGGTPFLGGQYDINSTLTDNYLVEGPLFSNFFNPQTGTFRVRVQDSNGCVVVEDVEIPLQFSPGDPCDDQDPTTINDQIQSDCTCAGEPAGDLFYLGNSSTFLPGDIIIEVPSCTRPYIFTTGIFTDQTGTEYPFPLERGVHFDGIGMSSFVSSVSPLDEFEQGETLVQYTIADDLGNELVHEFTVTVMCGCSGVFSPTCEEVITSGFFSCNINELLNGYQSCTPPWDGSNIQAGQPNPLCVGGVPNNMSWFAFIAGDSNLTVEVLPTNCQPGGSGVIGLSAGVYDGCSGTCIGGNIDCDQVDLDLSFSINDLVLGEMYYLFIDGCFGSECFYEINIEATGFTTSQPTGLEFSSNQVDQACNEATNDFCRSCAVDVLPIQDGTGTGLTSGAYPENTNAQFQWTIDPPINGIDTVEAIPSVDGYFFPPIMDAEIGSYTICLIRVIEECDTWTGNLCEELVITDCTVIDNDNDMFGEDVDCDDNNADVFPGAPELCDGLDNNCDGFIDEGLTATYYTDSDMDGFGDPLNPVQACALIDGLSINFNDCDDTNANIFPGAPELCDNLDNNCDGIVDEGIAVQTYYADVDLDSFGNPMDSVLSCFQPFGFVIDNMDCDDSNPNVNPDAMEICDGLDNNCDGVIDEGFPLILFFNDADSDGFGNPLDTTMSCSQPLGFVDNDLDCDDNNPDINPMAMETCDTVDNNCDGVIDEGFSAVTYYNDADGDGFGDPATGFDSCLQPPDLVTDGTDCDDTDPNINPDAMEILGNGIDENCDGRDNTTSINELSGVEYNVYPNPTSDIFFVRGIDYSKIVVRDKLGRAIISQSNNDTVNLELFPSGVYLISLYNRNDEIVGVSKIVKQ